MSDEIKEYRDDIVHLARLGLSGRVQDVQLYLKRLVKRCQGDLPELAQQIEGLLRKSPTRSSPLRRESPESAMPVDLDSRLHLARVDERPKLETEPVFVEGVGQRLRQLIKERCQREKLERMGLQPTRSALFVGEPGVGKTLSAKWVARELGVPLVTLDLAAVMSSFLGRTGNNVRHVLEYAKGVDCVLLLDELDAIAKRRDDETEVGELKRLVTVLLQEIDTWPSTGLLLGATNHPSLLDPAIWRRFEMVVEFPKPDVDALRTIVERHLGQAEQHDTWRDVFTLLFRGSSFSDVEQAIKSARRQSVVSDHNDDQAFRQLLNSRIDSISRHDKADLAAELVRKGIVSQREAYDLTGVSRDTIRKSMKANCVPN